MSLSLRRSATSEPTPSELLTTDVEFVCAYEIKVDGTRNSTSDVIHELSLICAVVVPDIKTTQVGTHCT